MTFGIMNSSGNVLEWFGDVSSAHAALAGMLGEYPGADLVVLAFDDDGNLVRAKAKAVIHESSWLESSSASDGDAEVPGGIKRRVLA